MYFVLLCFMMFSQLLYGLSSYMILLYTLPYYTTVYPDMLYYVYCI